VLSALGLDLESCGEDDRGAGCGAPAQDPEEVFGPDQAALVDLVPRIPWQELDPDPEAGLASPGKNGDDRASAERMARDGRVVELLVNVNENRVVLDFACVHRDGTAGKHADRLAGGQVVARRVGGADQRVIVLQGALVKGLLLVGAGVVDRPDVVIIEADEADRFAQFLHEHGISDL
jgi:hypothetical protein